jgi:hypothetical protein
MYFYDVSIPNTFKHKKVKNVSILVAADPDPEPDPQHCLLQGIDPVIVLNQFRQFILYVLSIKLIACKY